MEQRLKALARANHIRFYRADLKGQIAKGQISLDDLICMIEDPPEELRTMRLSHLLCAVPGVGPIKTRKVLKYAKLNESTTVDGACEVSRAALFSRMVHWGR